MIGMKHEAYTFEQLVIYGLAIALTIAAAFTPGIARSGAHKNRPRTKAAGPRWSNDLHHEQGLIVRRDCVALPPPAPMPNMCRVATPRAARWFLRSPTKRVSESRFRWKWASRCCWTQNTLAERPSRCTASISTTIRQPTSSHSTPEPGSGIATGRRIKLLARSHLPTGFPACGSSRGRTGSDATFCRSASLIQQARYEAQPVFSSHTA
jgi:hypothetical protein